MLKRLGLIALLAIVLGVGWLTLTQTHQRWIHQWLERALNQRTQEMFHGSVRLDRVHLDRSLRLTIEGAHAEWQAANGPVKLQIDRIESLGPVTDALRNQVVTLRFAGAEIQGSARPGVRGILRVRQGDRWQVDLEADVELIGLDELAWISPQHLSGSSGEVIGRLKLLLSEGQPPDMSCELHINEPGGLVQSRVFELLVPYLPGTEEIKKLSERTDLVGYRQARLEMSLPKPNELKLLVHLDVPAYNLIVNLNVIVKVDDERWLEQVLRLSGVLNPS